MAAKKTVEIGDTVYYHPPHHVDARKHWGHGTVIDLRSEGAVAIVQTHMGGQAKAHISQLLASK
jgi:hypothetical protein